MQNVYPQQKYNKIKILLKIIIKKIFKNIIRFRGPTLVIAKLQIAKII